ncbi:MAG: ribonuclease III [Patescibacteria group bacterium]
MQDFSLLEKKLGLNFKNKDLLKKAFCHRSYLNENPDFNLNHYERLEFLGDAVLELIVTEYLFERYPDKPEGELTNWRASLVNAKQLAEAAEDLNLNDFLLLSRGETKEIGKARKYILGDVVESLIGAIYLDQGYEESVKFIKNHVLKYLPKMIEEGSFKDAKSLFQEIAQEKVGITPTYRVLKEWGPDHNKNFIVGVHLAKELIAEGQGSSKQEAEDVAAQTALEIKQW